MKRAFPMGDEENFQSVRTYCINTWGSGNRVGWWSRVEKSYKNGPDVKVICVDKSFDDKQDAESLGRTMAALVRIRQRDGSHGSACKWRVFDPQGNQIDVFNLLHWCRKNEARFVSSDRKGHFEQPKQRLADRVYQNLRDPANRSWFGWRCEPLERSKKHTRHCPKCGHEW